MNIDVTGGRIESLDPYVFHEPVAEKEEKKPFQREDSPEMIFRDLKEAEEYLESLQKEREILMGDFYGVNITAYRYVNIFYTLGYIHYRIREIDEEIEMTKLAISELKKNSIPFSLY